MRLLNLDGDGNLSLVERLGDNIPSYAILSHTWGPDNDEVSFKDLVSDRVKGKPGYRKVRFCADQAARDGLQYFWIDTCCIDKSSSAELSEAINSMFRWYQNAERCYVYLSDVSRGLSDGDEDGLQRWKPEFMGSRWFTRGWTLQELIAPVSVEFFSREWIHLGSKNSMEQPIHERTGVAIDALRGAPLSQFTMDERFMWAEGRTTKRDEDAVYCLLGIFDIQMPLLYGEGREKALKRLHKEIKESLGNRAQSLSDEQKQSLLDSLRFDQIDARQMTIKNAHAKTCKWLLRKSEYCDWLDSAKLSQHHGFLWIKGKPGTGKSTLMKFAFANARKTMKDTIVISFFFNARGEDVEKSTVGTYRSLLLQLFERIPALRSVFDSLGLSMSSTTTGRIWSIESLKTLLEHAIQSLGESPVVCFIDALDECDEAQIRDMISFFERVGEFTSSSGIHFQVCFSSRHYPHITIRKGLDLVLEGQEGHTQDIANYLETELKIGKSKLAQQVRGEIQEKASGVFMWVVLVVEILNKEHDRGRMHALRRRLQEIPSELHELFRDILTRDSDNRVELVLCIQWVLFAKQPLSPEQLYFAILSEVEADAVSIWDPSEITRDVMERFILDSSKGLTETTKSKLQKVQFIHESVRDFLLKEDGLSNIWPDLGGNLQGQSHERLKQCCLNYMSVDVFAALNIPDILPKASSREAADFRKSASEAFPFLEYAVKNVLHHANAAEGSGVIQAHFLENFQLPRWIRVDNLFQQHQVRRHSADVSLLYLLGEHNMPHLIGVHPSAASCLEVENERYGCPLFAAMATRSKEAFKMFLKSLAVDQSPEMESYEADANDFDEEWSQKGPGRDFKFSRNRGLFSYLADFECKRAVSFLLKTGNFDADSKDKDGRTALSWAVEKGYEAIVRLLIETGKFDVNLMDKDGQTALSRAMERDHEAVVRLLIKIGKTDVNSKDRYGPTVLWWAVEREHEAVVRLLLETGNVCVDSKTISLAVESGNEVIARLLLERGNVNIESKTILLAAKRGHEAVVKLLLQADKRADSNAQSGYYDGALYVASSNGHEKVVQILLQHMTDTSAEKATKRSASQAEIGSGDEDVVAKKPKAADAGSPRTQAEAEEEPANVGRGDENKDRTWASVVLGQD
ncbi:hypothetical protein BFW01_g381 [Lasiodiplodia theobromae]|uniref:Vegetative incompatibility protein HET-E-1 n=1 Tax=Lasiodiplodia theobromae TaxID=45133 RepID=A0A8H7MAJ1_9PEZI|nr:hypothetical protein BFW01_g381 [Lasiodiplodia theobromae]